MCGVLLALFFLFIVFTLISDYIVYILIGLAVLVIAFLIKVKVDAPKIKAKLKIERSIALYEACVDNGTFSLETEKDRRRAEIAAKELGIEATENLDEMFETGKGLSNKNPVKAAQLEKQRKENEERARLAKLREEEKEEYDKLTKYAGLEGNEKTIRMLSEEVEQLRKSQKAMTNMASDAASLLLERERDWAVAGGIASGLAGGAAGVAAALDAQAENAGIRARNAETMNMIAQAQAHLYTSGAIDRNAAKLQAQEKALEKERFKLYQKLPAEALDTHLSISDTSVSISDTGAFRVSANVEMTDSLIIFDNVPARIDGTLLCVLNQYGADIAEAQMVLPLYGLKPGQKEKISLKGICLNGANAKLPYTVKFKTDELYAIEQ